MLKKLSTKITADSKRVVLQFFELNGVRTKRIINSVLSLNEIDVNKNLEKVFKEFSTRHRNFEHEIFANYKKIEEYIPNPDGISWKRKLLLGSYFSKEYSICSAALFNPSIVMHPVQSGVEKNSLRFIMSLRAAGEGHISSIAFTEGLIDNNGNVILKKNPKFSCLPEKRSLNSESIGIEKKIYKDLSIVNDEDLISSNYQCSFNSNIPLTERVLFPNSPFESVGMEDARFVRFSDDAIEFKYLATYTAYNGKTFRTQLIETNDFQNFTIRRLYGSRVQDKGMAIFPRKINGKYVITSRQDGENLFIMYSDNLYNWDNARIFKTPKQSWEIIQLGNCGSPIETDEGWILITHAVGPMRKYVISALLLDLDEPSKIIGTLKEPLIQPDKNEREGYVPNVVYSCGSIIHKKYLIIPYAFSDSACRFAKIHIKELLNKLKNSN